ncbi:DUF502 domain-containing protein [Pseudooceanicola sp. CBS1P-1]|uniref:DUF502 domain-containing protein n=1 Tax=Pseudooceanicola albus TaxID=2692189 RepID=A0A6L7FYC2_9RHOB|nr:MULTISPECIES: DUF502 domain-containing protein [Pseudooceanicola]MBT9383245.1 DUF502 domain-containing protein [Pseudooceanicola endophyticus]MXN16432.1 DUF502 domain-containing protein [Pseudooceanicola albus]
MSEPQHDAPSHSRPGVLARVRSSFLTGIVVILPVALTIWVLWSILGWIDSVVLPLVPERFQPEHYIGINLRGVGIIFFLVFTVIIGWVAKGLIGRSLIRYGESLVDRMPIVRTVYSGAKQIAETVFAQSERSFERACLIQYPRKGIWAIGFVSTEAKGELAMRAETGSKLMSIFVPTTPNPTSGFLLYLPEEDVTYLDMSIEDAAKLVISAGLVYPNPKDPTKPGKGTIGR